MSQHSVLTIEDDPAIRRGVVDALTHFGYQVSQSGDGVEGARMAISMDYDLLLLDLALPGKSGLQILSEVRIARPGLPIIILTAKGDERDRIAGLRSGADDYVVKPFSIRELLARVEAVLRRTPGRPVSVDAVQIPNGTADFARRELRFQDDARVELSERESELLRYLVCHRGRAISRDEILSHVWRISPDGLSTRTIDMHVARLREKLRDDPNQPTVLMTVRGLGYMFTAPLTNDPKPSRIES